MRKYPRNETQMESCPRIISFSLKEEKKNHLRLGSALPCFSLGVKQGIDTLISVLRY